jgi:hypothetical protein
MIDRMAQENSVMFSGECVPVSLSLSFAGCLLPRRKKLTGLALFSHSIVYKI